MDHPDDGLRLDAGPIHLRDFRPGDLDDVAAVVGDDRVTTWMAFDSLDRAGARRMVEAAIVSAGQEPRTEYYLAVVEAGSDRVIGFARLALSSPTSAKLGYAIHAGHWGRGYAGAAARALLDLGFSDLGLHRITAAAGPANERSVHLLEKLGFTREGRLRDHVFANGAWRDSLLFSLLAHEHHRS